MNDKTTEAEIVQTMAVGRPIEPPTHIADLPALMQLAAQLVPTGFLPAHITTPGQAVAIILSGRELGIGPMLALRSIYMIKGKIELSADLQLSLFKRDGGQAEFTELSETKAQLKLKHPNGDRHVETFTIDDARRAGLTGDNWKKFPKAMLRSRVITAALKSLGFEPKMSGCYAPGEIGGPETIEAEVQEPPKAPTKPANGNGHKTATERITALASWLTEQLGPQASWVVPYLRSHTPDGAENCSALLPNEDLPALSEAMLDAIKSDPKGFLARVKVFAQANMAPEKKIEVPRDADAGTEQNPDWWREVVIHFGTNQGTKLGELETKTIFGWWKNWTPSEDQGTTEDLRLRRAIDCAGAHYQFK